MAATLIRQKVVVVIVGEGRVRVGGGVNDDNTKTKGAAVYSGFAGNDNKNKRSSGGGGSSGDAGGSKGGEGGGNNSDKKDERISMKHHAAHVINIRRCQGQRKQCLNAVYAGSGGLGDIT